MEGHEAGMLVLYEGDRCPGEEFIEVGYGLGDVEGPNGLLELFEIADGTGESFEQGAVFAGTDGVCGDEVVDAAGIDADWPEDTRGSNAGSGGGLPEGWDLDVGCEPVPFILVLEERIEADVVVDAMFGRPDAGDERGMTGVSHGWQNAYDTIGIGAIVQEA